MKRLDLVLIFYLFLAAVKECQRNLDMLCKMKISE